MTAQRQPDIDPEMSDLPFESDADFGEALGASSPFEDGSVEGLFYPGGRRQEVLDQLNHLLRYGPSLLVLHGDQGIGKGYLVNHLLASLDSELFDVATMQADVLMSAATILSSLSEAWRCRAPLQEDTLQEQLVECASVADEESRVLLLALHHSQFLDEASVALLSAILASCASLPVKILLVLDAADPEDIGQLASLFDQAPDHFRVSLAPFTRDETTDYLAYRLHTGGLGHVRFGDAHIEQIFNLSLGNPARINQVAAELLLASMPSKVRTESAAVVPWMHVGALVLVAGLLLLLVLTRGTSSDESRVVVPVAQPGAASGNTAQATQNTAALPSGQNPLQEPVQKPAQVSPQESQLQPRAENAQSKASSARELAVETRIEPVATPAATAKPAPAPSPPVEAVTPAPVAAAPAVETPPAAKPAPAPVKPESKPVVKPVDARSKWILSLPSEHYALQLLGAKEKDTVDKFLAQYPSVQKLSYYQTQRNGAPWYVVVQASFPSYDAAKAAVEKLPQKLQKQGPWIRKIEAIQKDLKN